jgi:hypothetical protein
MDTNAMVKTAYDKALDFATSAHYNYGKNTWTITTAGEGYGKSTEISDALLREHDGNINALLGGIRRPPPPTAEPGRIRK